MPVGLYAATLWQCNRRKKLEVIVLNKAEAHLGRKCVARAVENESSVEP